MTDAFLRTTHKINKRHEGKSRIGSRFAGTGDESRNACELRSPKRDKIDWAFEASQMRKRKAGTRGSQANLVCEHQAKRD